MFYPRYIQYAFRRRALNADGTTKSWAHKYPFKAEAEFYRRIPFNVQNNLLEVVVQFQKRDCTSPTKIRKY